MEFQIPRRSRPAGSWVIYVPGAACVLLGILIFLMPQLLVALVAGTLIVTGALMLSLAHRFGSGGNRVQLFHMMRDRFRG